MANRTVLICGSGVAGPTLAYWLARHGLRPTVVERTQGLRSSGSPVDVRGPAEEVAERMGIMPLLRKAATEVTNLSFVNAAGRQVGRVNTRALERAAGSHAVELSRGDLASILYQASRDHAEFLFDDTIRALGQDEHGVDVTFDRAAPRRFDLVVGADGLHSTVRGLVFGPEEDFVRHMGIYVATVPLDGPVDHPHDVLLHNTPGRLVSVHPGRGRAMAAFMFRSPNVADFDHRDTAQHRRLLTAAFADATWRTPELLDQARAADDLYFDSVSQVRIPDWSTGRVALIGDAASCLSLLGEGSSLAMLGAATLADALGEHRDDHRTAFRRYQERHWRAVEPKLRLFNQAARVLIPATRGGIAARNLATRLWPVAAATTRAGRLRRRSPRPTPEQAPEPAPEQAAIG